MKRLVLAAAAVAAITGAAHAQKKRKAPTVLEQIEGRLDDMLSEIDDDAPIKFAFHIAAPIVDPPKDRSYTDLEFGFWVVKGKATAAVAADGKAVVYAADLAWSEPCGDETCPRVPKADGHYHLTMVLDGAGPWKPAVWHLANTVTAKDQKAAMKGSPSPEALEAKRIAKGAEGAVTVFEATIGDPKALAKSVSARTDVVLYGSDLKERYVGGAKVAATLAKWNLGFKVRDGIEAGATTSGTVAWVAANVDAASVKKPGKPTPYRALFVYENHVGSWQLIQAHFSFVE